MRRGLIFDIKRYAIHDGPGIRTTVFFKGCPLNCSWCANPESQKSNKEFIFWPDKCLQCNACVGACKLEAIRNILDEKVIDYRSCNFCGDCIQNCYSEALQIIGQEITVEELLIELEKDRSFYLESGGGVTFSGGEPLFQFEFLYEVLGLCKERNLHTTVDTCGFVQWSVFEKVSDLVDLYLYDVKLIDDRKHKKYTGVSNSLILSNLGKLLKCQRNVIVRVPLIPEVNDDLQSIKGIGEHLSKIGGLEEIHLLPYHKLGISKYKRMHLEYELNNLEPPSQEQVNSVLKRFGEFRFKLRTGG